MTNETVPAALHGHTWNTVETIRCEDGHEMVISICACGARLWRCAETSEEILSSANLFTARITHHTGVLYMEARWAYLGSILRSRKEQADVPQKAPVLN